MVQMIKQGIVDPTKVVRSIRERRINRYYDPQTEALITDLPEKKR